MARAFFAGMEDLSVMTVLGMFAIMRAAADSFPGKWLKAKNASGASWVLAGKGKISSRQVEDIDMAIVGTKPFIAYSDFKSGKKIMVLRVK